MDGLQAAARHEEDIVLGLRSLEQHGFAMSTLEIVAHNRGFKAIARVARRFRKEDEQKVRAALRKSAIKEGAPDAQVE